MSGKEDEQRKFELKPGKVVALGESISTVSGSIATAYADLKGTFNVNQQTIVKRTNLDENMSKLVNLIEQQNTLTGELLKEEKGRTKSERWPNAITIIASLVAIVEFIIIFLRLR
jgi:hypothetical protein